ncbi:MAG: hypothetical protein B2I17_10110 [Thermoplasmatales archaeon B_DKE]|nr:MAG: hypothetical protein B2I17_10110 [Thermoplasmatales archaeon B_DKE]
MPKLPVVSGKEVVKVLSKLGFRLTQQSGSHMKMRRDGQHITVPNHSTLKKGTLHSILNQVDLTVDEFLELL